MTLRKWLVRSLVFTVTAGLAAAGFAYQHWTNPAIVRQQVLARLSEHLPGANVSVESARLWVLGGISFSEIRLTRRDDAARTEFAYIPSGMIYPEKDQLFNGKLAIRKLDWNHPRLRVIRYPNGRWNLAGISEPHLELPVPTIVVQKGTIIFEDQQHSPDLPPLEIKNVNLTIVNDPLPTIVFQGTGVTDLAGPIKVNGTWGRQSGELTVSVQVPSFAVGGTLVQRLAAYCPEAASHARQLTGTGSLEADLRYHPKAPRPWSYDVRGQLTRGTLNDAKIPQPLENLQAKVRFVDGQVIVETLTAESGPLRVELAGTALTPCPDADLKGHLKIAHLPLTAEMFKGPLANLQALKDDFHPEGTMTLEINFRRHAGQWRAHCILRPEDLTVTYTKFPYRLDHLTGTIDHEKDASKSIDVTQVKLTGYSAAQAIHIEGKVEGPRPAALDFKIWGQNVPLDDKLRAALKRDFYERVVLPFHARGMADIEANIRRRQGETELRNRYLLHFHDCSLQHDAFPYPVEHASGMLDIQADHWEFHDFQGSHQGGEFHSHGGSFRTATGNGVEITITGDQLLLDEELEAALKRPMLKTTWRKLAPAGRMWFATRVRLYPNQSEPDIWVTVKPLGCSIHPEFFPYDLTDLRGTVQYHGREVDLTELSAHHGPSKLTIQQGKVYLKPEGGFSVDLRELVGNPVMPDADLVHALPAGLGQTCAKLELKDPLSFRATQFTVDMPAEAGSPPQIYWDGGVRLQNASVRAGVPFDHVSGVILLRGEHKGTLGNVMGNLEVDEARLFNQPFRHIHSQIVVSEREPNVLTLPNLKAYLFAGEKAKEPNVGGTVRVEFGPSPRYEVDLRASQLKLEDFAQQNQLGPKAQMEGLAAARLFLKGQGTDPNGLEGEGSIDVPNGKISNLPPLLDLLKVLNLRWPDKTAFEEARARFAIHGQRVDISRLDLFGNAVSLTGQGTMKLDGTDLNLDFYAVWARVIQWLPPVIDKIPPWISEQLLKIKMRGQIDKVECTKEPLPPLVEPIKEVLKRMRNKQG